MINEEIRKFIEKFKSITELKYIKGINNSTNAIGLTFEKIIGKEADSTFFPDYHGIEIKCTGRFSRYPISLFSKSFDGPTFPEIERIIDKYGYYDHNFKNRKVFYATLDCKNIKKVNNKEFKFEVESKENKLYLCVYENKKMIEKKSYVYLDEIYKRLKLKINILALVHASIKRENNYQSFRYYRIDIYKLKEEKDFINALKKGYIKIDISARIAKSGAQVGKYKNKNLVFKIEKEYINELFEKKYYYDKDENR